MRPAWYRDVHAGQSGVTAHPGEVLDEGVDEIGNRVALRHHRRRDAELLRRFGGDRSDRRDDRGAQQIGRLFVARSIWTKFRTADALVNVTASICRSSSIR